MSKLSALFFAALLLFFSNVGITEGWDAYYTEKLKDPPRALVKNAIESISSQDTQHQVAYDLGAGVGNETLFLLQNGYSVIAIDNQPSAINFLKNRPGMHEYSKQLTTYVESFETIPFDSLPSANIVVASAAIPFCNPKHFDAFWKGLINKIVPGGYFIGDTFDPTTAAFSDEVKQHMTFHTLEETKALFKDFDIISIKAIDKKGKIKNEPFYVYEVVARKRA